MKKLIFTAVLFILSLNVFTQVSFITPVEKVSPPEPVVEPYDSLMNISDCKDYKMLIGQEFYNSRSAKYFILSDYVKTEGKWGKEFKFKEKTSGNIFEYPEYSWQRFELDFILVPYFVKQKQLCENKYFRLTSELKPISYYYSRTQRIATDIKTDEKVTISIEDKSRWFCKEVALDKREVFAGTSDYKAYQICYILTNEQGNTVKLFNEYASPMDNISGMALITDFQREDIYLTEQRKKQAEAKKTQQMRNQEESQRKASYISKYGQTNGNLIYNKKVALGFTPEMCKASWENPFNTTKTTTAEGTYEIWSYGGIFGSGRALHFLNGKLVKIVE